ncbi:hypothetical protein EOPP23_12560 [Endozoicomonas sp. OPT23]|uniref:TetR/AcrR family transcriptional regulator n=1 Tax=Endozoicomonas sp. OPT23 TaxID=2072845 RepID=UPI00129A2F21|nr:TetR/AcrR family transcriptional regulator [Endozoicomonas sp. OPT23]MRI33818.1 hypothetical protein [Endozoicomonas sp. OPT23]
MNTAIKPLGKEEVKRALVEAGIKLFSERGIKAVTIRDIAKQANVNSVFIYRHFENKDGLVSAVVSSLFDRMESIQLDGEDSGEQMLYKSVLTIRTQPEVFRIFAHLSLENEGDFFEGIQSPYIQQIIEKIRQSQQEGKLYNRIDPEVLLASSYALGLGWHIFKPMLIGLAGLDSTSKTTPKQVEQLWFDMISRS